ncbi:hypothetical protein Tco_0786485 [Tanacetum coccineum]
MPNSNPIEGNSPTISPFPKDSTMHIPYTDANTFADVVLLNHVGEKEFKSIVGDGIGVLTKKKIKRMTWDCRKNRTGPLPPHAHTEQVNVVFTESGMSDDFPEIQIDQPSLIIVNNKIEKDKPIKMLKGGYQVVETKEYPFSGNGEGGCLEVKLINLTRLC